MARIFGALALILTALSIAAYSQNKSIESALEEAAGTPGISVAYDETRYLTKVGVNVDAMADNESFKKQMKRFEWTLESWFAIKGIDSKPVRVVLCADTQAKRFLFQRNSELTLTFDGEDVLLGEGQRTSEYKGGKAKENVCWEVDKVITDDFAKAVKASFSVGGLRGSFSSGSLAKFRGYGSLVTVGDK
jgi:hypothetical protein